MTAAAAQTNRLVSRRYGAHGHGYLLDGEKVPGVTSILDVLPKQLKQWASDVAADYAIEHWDELALLPMTKRLDRIRYAHKDTLGKAAARGTEIHRYGEQLVHGEAPAVPEEYRVIVEKYARFLDLWKIEPIATEAAIVNLAHRYGGKGDLWATVGARDGARCYLDLKSGKNVYESVVHQCVAYDNAELWQPDGPESEQPYEPVDLIFVVHITPDDVVMLPVRGEGGAPVPGQRDFRNFLYLKQVWHWLEAHGWKGEEPLVEAAVRPEDPA